jgi:hypothetical protein
VFAFGTARQSWLLSMAGLAIDHVSGRFDLAPLDPDEFPHAVLAPGVSRVDRPLQLLNRLPAGAAEQPLPADAQAALDTVQTWLRSYEPGMRVVVANPGFAALLRQFAERDPERRLSVFYVPGVAPA